MPRPKATAKTIDEWLDRIGMFPITEGRRLHGLKEARDRGYMHYWLFTEADGQVAVLPCKRGHMAPRYVESRICMECNALAAAASRKRKATDTPQKLSLRNTADTTVQNRKSVS